MPEDSPSCIGNSINVCVNFHFCMKSTSEHLESFRLVESIFPFFAYFLWCIRLWLEA